MKLLDWSHVRDSTSVQMPYNYIQIKQRTERIYQAYREKREKREQTCFRVVTQIFLVPCPYTIEFHKNPFRCISVAYRYGLSARIRWFGTVLKFSWTTIHPFFHTTAQCWSWTPQIIIAHKNGPLCFYGMFSYWMATDVWLTGGWWESVREVHTGKQTDSLIDRSSFVREIQIKLYFSYLDTKNKLQIAHCLQNTVTWNRITRQLLIELVYDYGTWGGGWFWRNTQIVW